MMEPIVRLDSVMARVHTVLMSTDPYAMLLHRRREIASELDGLRERLRVLEAEDQELAAAEKVLARFGAELQPDMIVQGQDGSATIVQVKTIGKPEGTPTTPNMILALLREAQAHGKKGLEPRDMQISISKRWWPAVKSEDVGPTAWRMWKDGRLAKDGSLYMLPIKTGIEEAAGLPWEKPAAAEDRG